MPSSAAVTSADGRGKFPLEWVGTPAKPANRFELEVSTFRKQTRSIRFFDSVIAFEREEREEPWFERR